MTEPETEKTWVDKHGLTIVGVVGLVFLLFPLWIGLAAPYFESQTFNRLTGANTTYWDAVWVELRVDCQNMKR